MIKKIIVITLFFCFSCKHENNNVIKMNRYSIYITNDTVNSITKRFLSELQKEEKKNYVIGMYIEKYCDTTKILLYPVYYLSEIAKLKPCNYFFMDENIVFIISGIEDIVSMDEKFKENFIQATKKLLINNINEDGSYSYDIAWTPSCWEINLFENTFFINKNAKPPDAPPKSKVPIKFLKPNIP